MFVSVIRFTIGIVGISAAQAVNSVWVPGARVSDQVGNGVDDEVTEDLSMGTEVVEGGRLGCRVRVWVTKCLRIWVMQSRRI